MKEWKWKNNFKYKLISSTDFPVLLAFLAKRLWKRVIPCGNSRGISLAHTTAQGQFEKTLCERKVIIFIAVIVVGYWTGSFPVISPIPTLLLKLCSTGPMHVKNFLVWEKKRKRGKWISWRCIAKESFSFRPFAVKFLLLKSPSVI